MRLARNHLCALVWLTVALSGPTALGGQSDNAAAFVGGLGAGAGIVGIGIFDIATAPSSARRHNELGLALAGEAKSPRTALLWSLGATLIPSGLGLATAAAGGWNDNNATLGIGIVGIAAGWVFGPSAGHWYAERPGRAWTTTGVRAGLMALGVLALSTVSFD